MNKCILLGLLALCANANASTISIGFDHTASQAGTSIGNDYLASEGIAFTQAYYSTGNLDWMSGEPDTTNMNGILNQPISGYFAGVTDYMLAQVRYADGGTITTLNVFDINNALLASVSTTATNPFQLSVAISGIRSFDFSFSNPDSSKDDIIGIDNLTFNAVSQVPVPPSALLLFSGLVGLASISRKRG